MTVILAQGEHTVVLKGGHHPDIDLIRTHRVAEADHRQDPIIQEATHEAGATVLQMTGIHGEDLHLMIKDLLLKAKVRRQDQRAQDLQAL